MSTSITYYYGAYVRLKTNKAPILTCSTESDKFTVNANNGNGALTYPVGLITADEVAMAGGVYDVINSSYYLCIGSSDSYWLGSPHYFYESTAFELSIWSQGKMYTSYDVSDIYGIRPVISLSSKAKLSGDGTWNNVYIVK